MRRGFSISLASPAAAHAYILLNLRRRYEFWDVPKLLLESSPGRLFHLINCGNWNDTDEFSVSHCPYQKSAV